MDVFTIDGRVIDGSAWTMEEPVYAPTTTPERRTRGFHQPAPGAPGHVVHEASCTCTSLPTRVGSNCRGSKSKADARLDTITIELRGKVIDTKTLSDHEWHTLSYSILPSKSTLAGGEWIILRVDPPWKIRGDRCNPRSDDAQFEVDQVAHGALHPLF